MSEQTVRIIITGALFVHGIGHILGFWKPPKSISLVKITRGQTKLFAGSMWVLIALGFIISTTGFYGILVPASW